MAKVELKPGERTEVLNLFSDSMARTIRFDVTTTAGAVSGQIDVERALLPFLKPRRETAPLGAENALDKSWLDGQYKVFVTSDTAAELNMKTRALTRNRLFLILLVVAGVGLIAGIMPLILAD
ncbi:hypothetical protein N4R57_05875 [Rhodobacteraceae bacterium D3-12]|nr:hypothetical protein N4R57_05875 [Rhodobacteraceae bacterium D3-12]